MTIVVPTARIAVFGLGDVRMGDDALGSLVVERLRSEFVFQPEVLLRDLGGADPDLFPYLAGRETVILVTTLRPDGPAGEVRVHSKDDLLRTAAGVRAVPLHPSVRETLLSLELSGDAPDDVELVGVIPGDVSERRGLTEPVLQSVRTAMAAVLEALVNRGSRFGRRRQVLRGSDLGYRRESGQGT